MKLAQINKFNESIQSLYEIQSALNDEELDSILIKAIIRIEALQLINKEVK